MLHNLRSLLKSNYRTAEYEALICKLIRGQQAGKLQA